jgi:3-deoxy-D-arabino-heptulosonate 7-phosphate (DAHP) synthase
MLRLVVKVRSSRYRRQVHSRPERALPDGAQSLNLDEFAKLMKGLTAPIRPVAICARLASANAR